PPTRRSHPHRPPACSWFSTNLDTREGRAPRDLPQCGTSPLGTAASTTACGRPRPIPTAPKPNPPTPNPTQIFGYRHILLLLLLLLLLPFLAVSPCYAPLHRVSMRYITLWRGKPPL